MDLAKIKVIMEFLKLKHAHKLHYFYGLVGYYRRFLEEFSKIANAITKVKKKFKEFVWI